MNFKLRLAILITFVLISFLATSLAVLATQQPVLGQVASDDLDLQDQAFLEASGLGTVNLAVTISLIIKIILGFLGVIFVILLIYAGFMWMTSAGNEEKISKAKKTMITSIIGLAIILSAYIITIFVLDNILVATGIYSYW